MTLYEKYLKAAFKFTMDPKKHAHLTQRPALAGVLHHEDGSLIATDTIRMIRIGEAHDQEGGVVLDKAGKDLRNFLFPDVNRLLKQDVNVSVENADIGEWIKGHELMDIIVADRVDEVRKYEVDGKKKTARLNNHIVRLQISNREPATLTARWDVIGSGRHEFKEAASDSMQIAYNAAHVIEALKVLKSFGHKTCTFRFKSAEGFSLNPFTIGAGNIWIMQLPVRTY